MLACCYASSWRLTRLCKKVSLGRTLPFFGVLNPFAGARYPDKVVMRFFEVG
jgi:hypothetical protein